MKTHSVNIVNIINAQKISFISLFAPNNILNMNNHYKVQYAHDLIHLAFDINSKRQRYPLQITTQIFNQN